MRYDDEQIRKSMHEGEDLVREGPLLETLRRERPQRQRRRRGE